MIDIFCVGALIVTFTMTVTEAIIEKDIPWDTGKFFVLLAVLSYFWFTL